MTGTLIEKKETFFSRLKNKIRRHWFLFVCMALPALIMLLIYLARGHHPFGDGSVLTLDLNGQYVWFFEALRNFAHGDANALYSFARSLGGDFVGIYAYYVASPLSYIVALFPEERMLEALLTLFLVKVAICGGTFGYYMHRRLPNKSALAMIIFATCYALSAYAVVQQHNTMWIDAVMWLPLLTLGLEELIKYGKFKMYTIFLALTVFSNFYIGYMVCFYCFFYFFVFYFGQCTDHRNNPLGEKAHFIRSLLRILLWSILALGIAALMLLGAYYSLNFGKTTFGSPSWEWKINFPIVEFLYKLLPGSYDTVRPDGLPFIYCGLLTLLLLPGYFLSKKYATAEKVASMLFIILIFATFTFSVPDLIMHVFHTPVWLNYRYSFMLTFILCTLGCKALDDLDGVSHKTVGVAGGFIALLCVILQTYSSGEHVKPNSYTCVYFTIALVLVYFAVFASIRTSKKANKTFLCVLLLTVVSTEAFLSGLFNTNALGDDVGYGKYSTYNNFLKNTRPLVNEVQASDDSFYRMEKTYSRKVNDNMAMNIRGLSGSTSTLNKETIKFLNVMGYCSHEHWSNYFSGTPVNDSLLGLKYILADNNINDLYYEVYKKDEQHHYTAYYNPYALSLAYGVDDDLLDFKLGFTGKAVEESDPKKQSAISDAVDDVKNFINSLLDIEENICDEYLDDYVSPPERLNAIVTAMLGEDETVQLFVPISVNKNVTEVNVSKNYYVGGEVGYTNKNPDQEGRVTFSATMPVGGELFLFAPTNYHHEVKLELDIGEGPVGKGTFNGGDTTRIVSLGIVPEERNFTLSMITTDGKFFMKSGEPFLYYLDFDLFKEAFARLGKDQFKITEFTESEFNGTFQASRANEVVLTTLPYDNGWKIYVDGEPVEITKALGALIAFRVGGNAGDVHEIRMVYQPFAIKLGLYITIGSVALFVLLCIVDHFCPFGCRPGKKKKKNGGDQGGAASPASPCPPDAGKPSDTGKTKSENNGKSHAKPNDHALSVAVGSVLCIGIGALDRILPAKSDPKKKK